MQWWKVKSFPKSTKELLVILLFSVILILIVILLLTVSDRPKFVATGYNLGKSRLPQVFRTEPRSSSRTIYKLTEGVCMSRHNIQSLTCSHMRSMGWLSERLMCQVQLESCQANHNEHYKMLQNAMKSDETSKKKKKKRVSGQYCLKIMIQAILLHHFVNNLQIVCFFLDPAGLVGVDRSLGNSQRIHVCEVCTHIYLESSAAMFITS